jgi:hypothetical protein
LKDGFCPSPACERKTLTQKRATENRKAREQAMKN